MGNNTSYHKRNSRIASKKSHLSELSNVSQLSQRSKCNSGRSAQKFFNDSCYITNNNGIYTEETKFSSNFEKNNTFTDDDHVLHTFIWGEEAENVILAGSFSNWTEEHFLVKESPKRFRLSLVNYSNKL